MRNRLFDIGLLRSRTFSIPSVNVGNLALGGTGKTPHIEWLIKNLGTNNDLLVLSRGYGRTTKGHFEVSAESESSQVGDEPLQIKINYPGVSVVVDENRTRAISQEQNRDNPVDLILLDDAMQHRRVQASVNLMLTTYQRPFFKDWLVPAGNLRDNRFEKRRADAIIITKCPASMTDQDKEPFLKKLSSHTDRVWFSHITYGDPTPVFDSCPPLPQKIIGLAAIANPELFKAELVRKFELRDFIAFRDHREFVESDIQRLASRIGTFEFGLVTTAKDAVRLKAFEQELSGLPIYKLPIEVEIEHGERLIELIKKEI